MITAVTPDLSVTAVSQNPSRVTAYVADGVMPLTLTSSDRRALAPRSCLERPLG